MTLTFLIELRKRLLYSLTVFGVVFAVFVSFANPLYTLLAKPLLQFLPKDHAFIATDIAASFFVPLELTAVLAVFVSIPFFLYQFWAFVMPALYRHEKKFIWPFLLISTFLFYLGVLFAYFVIFPILFGFLTHSLPQGVSVAPDMSLYLDFALKLLVTFGVIFEVPVVLVFLIRIGWVERAALIRLRPYVIVGAFIVAMLLGPPDVLSQTLLAIPLWLLFEVGVYCGKWCE